MTTARPFAVSADGTSLHATDVGRGHPLLIVHGGMQSAARWADVAALLAPRWRIIALERPVYGLSGTSRSTHSMAREADDVVATLAAIGEAAIVLGHSSGGIAALEAALLERPAGLILYEAPVPLEMMHFGEALAAVDAAVARGDLDAALRLFFVDMLEVPEFWVDQMRDDREHPGGWAAMQGLLPAQLADVRAIRELPRNVARYASITAPTLLVEGELSPRHLHQRLAALGRVIPDSTIFTIARHGHSANLEAPEVMAEIIEKFARRIFGDAQAAA